MTLSPSRKIVLWCGLTLVVAGIFVASLFVPRNNTVLFFAGAVVLVNFVAAFWMLRNVTRQLQAIARVADEVGKGNYNVVVPPTGTTELRKLVEAFNVMAYQLKRHDLRLTHKAYQNAILKEITDRISSSLDVNEALEIIAGSLEKVVSYSTVSYLTRDKGGKLVCKCHLEESVSRAFVEDVKKKMCAALRVLSDTDISEEDVKLVQFGTIFDERSKDPVRAFFNLPMIVGGKVVGIINVASRNVVPYEEEETEVLYSIVAQAGATITKIKTLIAEETGKVDSMLASLAEGIIMVTAFQEVAVINEKAKEILGISGKKDISILDTIQALYGKLDFRGATEKVLASRATETFPEFAAESAYFKVTAGPVKSAKGDLMGVVFIFSDITREREIDKMKSEFISVTSHQLRTPLSSMKWFLEMLLGGDLGALPEKQKSVMLDVYNSNERVITLVNDLLDVSRIESGKIVLEPTPTNLVDFLKSMLPEVEQQFKKRNQIFEFKRQESLPRISIDPRLIWQVIQNLLTNASKYTPEEGKIALELSSGKKDMLVKVQDNGYGIPEFQKHRVFEKFFRADNVSKMEGTGLGLYIAKEIAEASGGKLWFESTEGKGTAFFLSLPLAGSKPSRVGKQAGGVLP